MGSRGGVACNAHLQRGGACCAIMFARCQNPDLQDFRINRIIEHDVGKSGKSFNQENQGSDKRATARVALVALTSAIKQQIQFLFCIKRKLGIRTDGSL